MKVFSPAHWHRFERCGSTNDEAQRLARAGAAAGTVVVAAEQTQGRGRLGRTWHSPAGQNLYLSVVLRPRLPPPQAPLLVLCAGLAMHRAAKTFLAEQPARLRLKWPNDLLGCAAAAKSDESGAAPLRKLGGILTELVCTGMAIDFVIIGVGCNVHGRDFPADISATSLHLLGAAPVDTAVEQLGALFLDALKDFYDLYLTHGARPIREAFIVAAELGPNHPPVVVKTAEPSTITGVPIDLGEDGALILRLESGAVTKVLAGDVALTPSAKIAN